MVRFSAAVSGEERRVTTLKTAVLQTRHQSYLPENLSDERIRENFSESSFHRIIESQNFRFPFSAKNSLRWRVKCQKLSSENRTEFIRQASKIIHKWKGHLEILSLRQGKENSRQFLLLRTDIAVQKTVVGCP